MKIKIEKNFSQLTIKQIRMWTWIAAVAPITGLAAIFFVWVFGTAELFSLIMIIGETTMFAVAVIWWWWAIYVIRVLVAQWQEAGNTLGEVVHEIREIKVLTKEALMPTDDK